jgi:hypothetical protein
MAHSDSQAKQSFELKMMQKVLLKMLRLTVVLAMMTILHLIVAVLIGVWLVVFETA